LRVALVADRGLGSGPSEFVDGAQPGLAFFGVVRVWSGWEAVLLGCAVGVEAAGEIEAAYWVYGCERGDFGMF
jgi:hypothetical protein